jgi:hypothetical protein
MQGGRQPRNLVGARRRIRRAPLSHVSQPVSRVLEGLRATLADVTAIPLGRRLPGASSNLPGRQDPDTIPKRARASLTPSLFGLAPGGVCRAAGVTAGAVRSYRTVSPLPRQTLRTAAVCSLWHCPWAHARRMLSGTACPWSPDFPPRQPFGFAGAAVRPTDSTGMGTKPNAVKRRWPVAVKELREALPCGRAQPWSGSGRGSRAAPAACCGSIDRQRHRRVPAENGAGRR